MTMNNSDLKQRTVSGMIWTAFQKFGTVGISFISNIILARLLSPDDYGCLGMLAIFIMISSTIVNGGFGSALIQKEKPSEEDYSTIFYWNIIVSIFLYLVLYVSAPLIASFYNMPSLKLILRVQGIILLLNALIIVQENQLRKKLEFKKLSVIYITSSVVSVVVAIMMAYNGYGVWSLVAQQLSCSFCTVVMLWYITRWHPILIFSFESFKELFSFGFYILLSDIINAISDNIQGILIGRYYNASTMGYYTQAHKIDQLASNCISTTINQVSYPVFSCAQNDKEHLIHMIRQFVSAISFIAIPIMFIIMILARPIILLLYSEKWVESVPYLQILCIAGIANCLQGLNYYAVAAKGLGSVLFKWSIPKRGLGILFIVIGLLIWGMKGLLIGMILSSYTIYFVNSFLVDKYIGYSIIQQLKDIIPIVLIAILSSVPAICVGLFLDINIVVKSLIQFILFMSLYYFGSRLLKLESYNIANDVASNYLKRR